jgi:hypothetical protein
MLAFELEQDMKKQDECLTEMETPTLTLNIMNESCSRQLSI